MLYKPCMLDYFLIKNTEGSAFSRVIKVILFDFDGVIAEEERFSTRLAHNYNISLDMTSKFFRNEFSRCLVGNADLKQEIHSYLPLWNWQKSVEDFLQDWFVCERVINEALIKRVQQLRKGGIRCYIATNQEKYRIEYIQSQLGLEHQFDGVFSSCHVKFLKNDAAYFERVMQEIQGIEAHEILFLDDSPENVATATKVGMHAIIYANLIDFENRLDNLFDAMYSQSY